MYRLQLDCRDKLVESTIPCRWSHHFSGFEIYTDMSVRVICFKEDLNTISTKISETILSVQPILKQVFMISVGSEPFRILMLFT